MGCVEPLIVLPVAALHFPIVTWSEGTDDFVADPVHFQVFLEKGGFFPVGGKAVGKFRPVVCLDAFNGAGKSLHKMIYKLGGRIGIMLLKRLHETPSGEFINGRILKELFADDLTVFQADGRDKFHIYLNTLARADHLLIRLGNVLWIGGMNSHDALFSEKAVESRDGALIAALAEFDPENDKSGVWITAAHIGDEPDLGIRVLVRMVMRTSGTVTQRVPGAVIASSPTVNVLAVGLVFDGRFRNAKFISIFNQ